MNWIYRQIFYRACQNLFIALCVVITSGTALRAATPETPYKIIKVLPHNKQLFTQGLEVKAGILYESAGRYGHSTINKISLATGAISQQLKLDDALFAEGLTHINNSLILLTWKSETALRLDTQDFKIMGSHRYTGEGWGICYDGTSLVTSNGSDQLTFRNPDDFRITRTLTIMFDDQPLALINELECTQGLIYANIWGQDIIVIIDPSNGKVVSFIDLFDLYDLTARNHNEVLNGIAYSPSDDAFWITGKNWSQLYLIKLTSGVRTSP